MADLMNYEIIKSRLFSDDILKIISRVAQVDTSQITDDILIREELGIDSLMGVEIIAMIEKEFDIEVDESLLLNMNSVGDFLQIIEREIDKKKGKD
jgi:acyl carrier protein